MKRKLINILILFMVFCYTANARSNSSPDQWMWYGNDHFNLIQSENELTVELNKKKWECFSLYVDSYNLKENPTLIFEIKTQSKIKLRIDAIDQTNRNLTITPIIHEIRANDDYQQVVFNFDKLNDSIDSSRISQFAFFVNAGSNFIGSLSISNIQLEATALSKKSLTKNELKLYPNPASNSCRFSISGCEADQIRISNTLGKVIIIEEYKNVNEQKLNLEKLTKGLYLVTALKNGYPVATERLIVQ